MGVFALCAESRHVTMFYYIATVAVVAFCVAVGLIIRHFSRGEYGTKPPPFADPDSHMSIF
jgi:hypothetical protein